MKHYEAYEEALKKGLCLTLRYLKFLFFGPPRSGKTSTRRRLLKEIINLDQLGVPSISTGVAEINEVIIKKLTSEQVAIAGSQWESMKSSKEGTQLDKYDEGDLAQLFYQLIYKQSNSTTPATSSEPIPKQSASTTPASSSAKQSASTTPATSSEPTTKQNASTTPATSNEPTSMQDSNEHSKSEAPDLNNPTIVPASTNNPTGENTKQDEQSDDATELERIVTQRLSDIEKSEINDAFKNLTSILQSDSPEDLKRLLEDLTMINMADVGGQPAFLDMLPALTIGPALYLLFFRLDQELQEHYPVRFLQDKNGAEVVLETSYCIEEVLYQCLASIACFSSHSQADAKVASKSTASSRALLFGTYKDKVDDEKISQIQGTLEDKFKATKLYKEGLLLKPLKSKMAFTVDNINGTEDSEMADIRNDIEGKIEEYFPAIPIPASWLMFRVVLNLLNKPVLSFAQCEEIAKRLSMPTSVEEAIWFFHHNIGSLMHYTNIPSMEDTVICNPQVIFDSISKLIIDKFQKASRAVTEGEIEQFHQRGLFTMSHIQDTTDHPQSSLLKLNQLVDVLKHHNILAEVKRDEEVASISESEPEPKFIMPAVMKYASESELLSPSSTVEAMPSPIFIHFDGGFVPFGVFCAGVVHLIAQLDSMSPRWQLCDDQVMRNKAKFIIDGAFFATLISQPQYIMVHVEQHPKARSKITVEVICSKVRKTVVQALETVILNMKYKPYRTLQVSIQQPFELAFTCNLEDSHNNHFMIVTMDDNGHHAKCLKSQVGFDLEDKHLIWFMVRIITILLGKLVHSTFNLQIFFFSFCMLIIG